MSSVFDIEELAKSEDYIKKGENSKLENHAQAVFEIVDYFLDKVELNEQGEFSSQDKEKILKVAAYLHDIGKKNRQFQGLLKGESTDYIKHEKQTLDYIEVIKEKWDLIMGHLDIELDYSQQALEEILAFAVSHHGLFFLSKLKDDEKVDYEVKKYWTEFSLKEESRITLTDLLFEYHPAGGFVILGDLIHSFSLAKGIDYQQKMEELKDTESILEFIEEYFTDKNLVAEKEEMEERATGALQEILKLSLGGVRL